MYNYRSSFPGGLDKAERPPWKVLDSNNTDITPYTEVEIQPGATTVGDQAFRFMSALKKAALGEGITHIGQYAFQFTSLEVPIFPSTLESMGQCAFHSVRTIRSLNLSHTRLTEIPYKCFEGASLASIKLPATLRAIGDSAFYESRGSTLVIPEGVEKIGADAFARCNFGNFSIPDTVKELGAGAFRSNEYLEEIHLPDSIEKMGSAVLSGCTNLTSVHLPGNPKLTELDSTLSACTALQQSTIPENVTTLTGTFSSCSALETVTLPQSLTTVGERAFAWCSKLKSMALPDSVTAIGKQAFFGNGTTTFTVPAGVTSIGKEAFSSTSGRMIDTITFGGTKAQWDALMTAGGDAETYYTLICSDGSYKYPETQGGSL